MNNIVLYSNNCPQCRILKQNLLNNIIDFLESENFDDIAKQGFRSLPVLKVNKSYLLFNKALEYIGTINNKKNTEE